MVASTLTGERGRRAIPGGVPRRIGLGGGRVGRATRVGLGAGPASRSVAALADGAAIFWDVRSERPIAWRRKAFRRWVDLIRGQLDPIGSLSMLAASFVREAGLPVAVDLRAPVVPHAVIRDHLTTSPLLAAYVVRWLELRDGVPLEPWRSIAR
jgi:hypothetical protein